MHAQQARLPSRGSHGSVREVCYTRLLHRGSNIIRYLAVPDGIFLLGISSQMSGSPRPDVSRRAAQDAAAAQGAPPPAPGATHEVQVVYENQRWLGAWQQPVAMLDHPPWSDADGNQVLLEADATPAETNPEWEVDINGGTDEEGWQYATVFKHLQSPRPGGRASRRFNDGVRRRAWRRRDHASAGVAVEPPSEAAAAQRVREAASQQRAIKAFLGLVLDLLSRRQLFNIMPWDPAALYILFQGHQETYRQLQAQAFSRRLFTPDAPAPPSLLRPDGTLVQDLLCAAVHSRAAYGFAMEQGLISSVGAYIKLQTLQPLM